MKRECTWCDKPATRQTTRGEENEKSSGLPINDGCFCDKCWEEGSNLEKEAIYG